jgi:hypothetical protein
LTSGKELDRSSACHTEGTRLTYQIPFHSTTLNGKKVPTTL